MKKTKLQKNGFSLIELIIVVLVIGILMALAIPNFMKARLAANESAAVSTLRTIASAQLTHLLTTDQTSFATLSELGTLALVDDVVASGEKSGYQYNINTFPKTTSLPARFDATAIPVVSSGPTATGNFSYLIIETGQVHFQTGSNPPTADQTTRVISNGVTLGN